MADGDYCASYVDVYDINKLATDDVPETVLDKHLERAHEEVEALLKTSIEEDQPSFSETVFNTHDLYKGVSGSILYFSDFEDYNYIQSVDTVEWRSDDSGSWETLTEGMGDDYNVDTRVAAVKFHYNVGNGYNDLRVSGTHGYTIANCPKNIKYFVAILAALQGIVYASGGQYTDMNSYTIGNITQSKGQYAPNLKAQYSAVKQLLDEHVKANGYRLERVSASTV